MKRSRALRVAYLGLAAGALAGCGEEPAGVFSMSECLSKFDTTVCTAAYEAARKEMAVNAPRFASKADCEAFAGPGNCETAPAATAAAAPAPAIDPAKPLTAPSATASAPAAAPTAAPQTVVVHESGGTFMPMMMGFMVGQMLANNASQSRGYYYGPPPGCSRYDARAPGCAPSTSSGSISGGGAWARGYAYAATPDARTAAISPEARAKSYVSSGTTLQQARSPVTARSSVSLPRSTPISTTTPTTRAPAASPPPSTVSRGGFGSTGRSTSGFSGS